MSTRCMRAMRAHSRATACGRPRVVQARSARVTEARAMNRFRVGVPCVPQIAARFALRNGASQFNEFSRAKF
eukprot:11213116-Lingulodinium_polyedra.AAC.1